LVSDQALRSAIVAGRPDLGMPGLVERAGEEPLTDVDVRDVVAWLAAHRVPPELASLDPRRGGGR
jgi:cytochrome c oxidase cbb3-type subunit 3/ubiquinol-cytochrome c reductase cytochrome c subunit